MESREKIVGRNSKSIYIYRHVWFNVKQTLKIGFFESILLLKQENIW